MSVTQADIQLGVIGAVQDAAGELGSEDVERAIQQAVRRYSKARPREIVEDEAGTGTHDLAVTALADWSEGLSVVKQIEYPWDADDAEPPILERNTWREYVTPTGRVIRFLEDAPAATETARITYTALHVVNEILCTIPEGDVDAVGNWAAVICLRTLAARFAQAGAPTINADSVDHKSKSSEYSRLARELWKEVTAQLQLADDETGAATVTVDWSSGASDGGEYFTHGRRPR